MNTDFSSGVCHRMPWYGSMFIEAINATPFSEPQPRALRGAVIGFIDVTTIMSLNSIHPYEMEVTS